MAASTSQTAVYRCTYCGTEMPGPALTEQAAREGRGKEWRPASPVPGQCEEHDGVHHPECCQAAAAQLAAQRAAEQARVREAGGEPWWKTPVLHTESHEPEQGAPGISRSGGTGAFINGLYCGLVGSGYRGITADLDAAVVAAAEALVAAYGLPVEIRFNTDRESGGAFLQTSDGRSNQVGIAASLVTARHRAQVEASAQEAEERARTGVASWQREPMTIRQRKGAGACAAYDRAWLAENPEGQLTVFAHLAGEAVPAGLYDELATLPGWNPMEHAPARAYHHGPADDVAAALGRCLHFAPRPGRCLVAAASSCANQDDETSEEDW